MLSAMATLMYQGSRNNFMENGTAHFLILFLKDKIERSKGIGEALKMVQ